MNTENSFGFHEQTIDSVLTSLNRRSQDDLPRFHDHRGHRLRDIAGHVSGILIQVFPLLIQTLKQLSLIRLGGLPRHLQMISISLSGDTSCAMGPVNLSCLNFGGAFAKTIDSGSGNLNP